MIMCVLGFEPGSSMRVASALNCSAISLAPGSLYHIGHWDPPQTQTLGSGRFYMLSHFAGHELSAKVLTGFSDLAKEDGKCCGDSVGAHTRNASTWKVEAGAS